MIQTSADVKVNVSPQPGRAATVVAGVTRRDDKADLAGDLACLPEALAEAGQRLIDDGSATGKSGETATIVTDGLRLVLIGVGEGSDLAAASRTLGAIAAKQAKRYKASEIAVLPLSPESADQAALGFVLGAYEYREYRGAAGKQREADALGKVKLTLLASKDQADAVDRAKGIADGQNYARTIASRPGNDINPPSLAKEAQRLAKSFPSLSCKVLDEKDLADLGMGGLLAVGQGSSTPPRLIVLEHTPKGAKGKKGKPKGQPLLIVGKAITFDTGGLSLKPPASMPSMIFDKCGGMAVLGAMAAIAAVGATRRVVGLLAAAENMPGPTAYRPGDILRMYNGITVDITNTDAEGRLVLADALTWGIETFKPAACVDLATLTGACVVALGNDRAGAWCNNDDFFSTLDAASNRAGEKLWRMPLGDEYREQLKAPSADIVNSPGRLGGACTAAEFLHHFIPGNIDSTAGSEVPWCHLDIAGTADTEKETALYTKGATGFGVRTLVEWVTNG